MNARTLLEKIISSSNDKIFKNFVNQFYSYIPIDYLKELSFEEMKSFAEYAYKYCKNYKGIRKLDHCNIKVQDKSNEEYIIFTILGRNMPFAVDAVKNLLTEDTISYDYIFHPVVPAVRDSKGDLVDILDKEQNSEESIIFFAIKGGIDKKCADDIITSIQSTLEKVDITIDSWSDILKEVDKTINLLTKKDNLEKIIDVGEDIEFLKWLKNDNFTFIGTAEFTKKDGSFENIIGDKKLWENNSELKQLATSNTIEQEILEFGKINLISTIYKNYYYDFIKVNYFDRNSNHIGGRLIIGVFSYSLEFQSVKQIPLLRQKFENVKCYTGFNEKGYNAKKMRIVFESLPRVALLHTSEANLKQVIEEVLSAMLVGNLKLFKIGNCTQNFIEILLFMPRNKFSPEIHQKIQTHLEQKFKVNISGDYISELGQEFVFIYSTFSSPNCLLLSEDYLLSLENELQHIIANWREELLIELKEKFKTQSKIEEYAKYLEIFPNNYQYSFTPQDATADIEFISHLNENNQIIFDLKKIHNSNNASDENNLFLRIYSYNGKLAISESTPILENLGFYVIDERAYNLLNMHNSYIHVFTIRPKEKISNFDSLKKLVEEKLYRISKGSTFADELSKLVTYSNISWREIDLIRAFSNYMHQINFLFDYKYVSSNLIKHSEFTKKLVNFFDYKFNPQNYNKDKYKEIYNELFDYLSNVPSSAEDKVLRTLFHVLSSAIRTNYYQTLKDNNYKNYISIKFDSSKLPDIEKPIPYAEIFVFSKEFEGVHIRGRKVARGGIRWSDRGEDYRTEVFGLMKAQMTKNTVIVPQGSKGGFFIKLDKESFTREEFQNKAIKCYQNFLRGLLDITDNVIGEKTVTPENVIIHDDLDPYLVVAADKGTATFSDYANQISNEYNFWLGDAFASGGSAGYDHKEMGITAKGAWVSIQRHFKELEIDVQNDPITVVGIGDMSGDVFGNGMLLSKSIKLIASFNHLHIFVDPDPDPHTSYNERKRLFHTPRSKWTDYNHELISKGGRIFERSSKIVKLTPEIKKLLSISKNELSPDELIKFILKAEVDILWNGGIGTYVKSSKEENYSIGDKANDHVRINGNELGARAVGEGGNLGLSQLGRIEYAKLGGMINTDFIDNSGGVDCSDHEVNIKIALGKALEKNKLNLESRNEFLSKMTDEVSELVLKDNIHQTLAITFMQNSSFFTLESFARLIDTFEKENLLQREVEFLPTTNELMQRANNGEKLTRPELSVILSYSKMFVKKDLENSKITTDDYFESWLIDYFPKIMQRKFKEEILNHPLKDQIILTIITNRLVNQISGPILNALIQDTGAALCDIVRGYVIVQEIFDINTTWDEVDNLPKNIPLSNIIEIYTDLNKVIRRGVTWMVNNLEHPLNIKNSINTYKELTLKISQMLSTNMYGTVKERYKNKFKKYKQAGIPENLAEKCAKLETLVSSFDIAHMSKDTGADAEKICSAYFKISNEYHIDWLRKSCDKLLGDSYWQRLSLQSMKDDLYDKQRRILRKIVDNNMHHNADKWFEKNKNVSLVFNKFMQELMKQENIDISMLIIANKKLEMFIRKS